MSVWRIMDANLNRVREGLRVCEDIVRFTKNDVHLTAKLKSLRHELNKTIRPNILPAKKLISSRESGRDVGKRSFVSNGKGIGYLDLLTSNFKRAEEGLRVLEECSKVAAPKAFSYFQNLRFKVYELEKEVAQEF